MSEAKDTFDAKVSRLSSYITRAYKYDKPSILFAMYMSEFLRTEVEKSLEKSLNEQGLKIVNIDVEKNKDIPSFISSINSNNTVFFVYNMEKGFPEALQFLNFKREELIGSKAKVVFWAKEEELARISHDAPDLFAFRNRVVEFMETPLAKEIRPALVEFAEETEFKSKDEILRSIELKEKLLSELSGEEQISRYLFTSIGILYRNIGLYKKALEHFEKALKIAKETGDIQSEVESLQNIGEAYLYLNNSSRAKEYNEKCLKMAQEIGDKRKEAAAIREIGRVYYSQNKYRDAIKQFEEALEIAQKIGSKYLKGASLDNLGMAYNSLGDMKKAIEYYKKALKIAQEIGARQGENNTLGNLGSVYIRLGDMKKAIEYYKKALKIAIEIGDRSNEGVWLNNLGDTFLNEKKYEEAMACYLLAKDVKIQIEDPTLHTTESKLKKLKEELGVKKFETLEAEVAPRAEEIVKNILEGTSI